MSLLVSEKFKTDATGLLMEHFNYFSRRIVIHKEPLRTIEVLDEANYPGYGEASNQTNYTYTPVSGIYSGRIVHADDQIEAPLRQLDMRIPHGGALLKVEEPAKNFILNGKTERIEADGKIFNVISDYKVKHYLGTQFYIFTLENTP
jgi:hypothetical protein